jgi:hypothetical protein
MKDSTRKNKHIQIKWAEGDGDLSVAVGLNCSSLGARELTLSHLCCRPM